MTSTAAIVNWNSGDRLRPCVESLLETSGKTEILVVDNASADASLESVQTLQDRVHLVRNSVNRGFAAAVNQAFHATTSSYVLVLNPDVRAKPRAVQLMEQFLEAHPRAAAVGGHAGEKYLPKAFPTPASLIRENLGLRPRHAEPASWDSSIPVDQPAAAALMIRRDAYDEAGGFDERFYPAWYEDVDFCRRVKAKGWEIYFLPEAEFLHEGGYSANAMAHADFLCAYYGNQLRYARKHFSRTGTAAVRASIAAGMIVRMIGRPSQAAAYGNALSALLRGH